MSYMPRVASDAAAITIRAAAVLTASYVASDPISVKDYGSIDFIVKVAHAGDGPITKIQIQIQGTDASGTPGANDWFYLKTEEVASGVATLFNYTVDIDSPAADGKYLSSTPIRGQQMRVMIKAAAGTATSSSVSIDAMRRV